MKGIRLEGKKEASLIAWTIKHPQPPHKIRIPIQYGENLRSIPCVSEGEHVTTGQKIALPFRAESLTLHATISGKVSAISKFPHPIFKEAEMIEIEADKHEEISKPVTTERPGWKNLSRESLLEIFQENGIFEMDALLEPLHEKLRVMGDVETLVLNGSEPEPYATSDHALMMSHPLEVLKGAEILRSACGASRIVILTGEHSREAAELLLSKIYFLKWDHCSVEVVKSIYPPPTLTLPLQDEGGGKGGGEFQLATAFAVYEAIVHQKPMIERAVTVGGECVFESKNVWIRIGTSFEEAFKTCRGFLREPEKVLMNGPMKGFAQDSLAAPVLPGTQAVLALPKEVARAEAIEPCIRCGRCLEVCPEDLSPAMITMLAEQNAFAAIDEYEPEACTECGNCAYVCPAKRPMVALIRYGRSGLILSQGEEAHSLKKVTPPAEIYRNRLQAVKK